MPTPQASSTPVAAAPYSKTAVIARILKARTMAWVLHTGGVSASDAAQMTPDMWRQFHSDLKSTGLLGGTSPSHETIAQAIAELRRLERIIPVCGAVRIPHLTGAA